jgi:phage/plasmid-associated DNA primase
MSWKGDLLIHSFPKIVLEQNSKKEWKKKPIGQMAGWQKITKNHIEMNHTAFGCLTGEKSGIFVMDFDNANLWESWINKFETLKNQPRIKTRKGFHVYFKWKPEYSKLPSKINNTVDKGDIDLQGNGKQVFYDGTCYITEDKKRFTYEWDANKEKELEFLNDSLFDELMNGNDGNESPSSVTTENFVSIPVSATQSGVQPKEDTPDSATQRGVQPKKHTPKSLKEFEYSGNIYSFFECKNGVSTELDFKMAELMSARQYLTDFSDWSKTMWAMRNGGYTKEYSIKVSKRGLVLKNAETLTLVDLENSDYRIMNADEFDIIAFDKIWNATSTKKEQLTKKTIYSQAYSTNKIKYTQAHLDYYWDLLELPYQDTGDDDYSVVKLFMKVNDDVVYDTPTQTFYTYFKEKWYIENIKTGYYAKIHMRNCILHIMIQLKKWIGILAKTYEEVPEILQKQKELCNNWISMIKRIAVLNTKWNELQLQCAEKCNTFEFNENPNLFAFKNKKFNFKTNQFEELSKDDYITMDTTYPYVEPTECEMEYIKNLIIKIFPNPEIRKSYLSIMYSCLLGYTKDKFVIANGSGGNGKGVINELLMYTLGEYAFEGSVGTLVEKMKTGGASPEIAGMNNKRLIRFKEPNATDKIKLGNLKQLCDNDSINARFNYSNSTKTLLKGTLILENNKRLKFDGTPDEAEARRFMDIHFESTFTSDLELLAKYKRQGLTNVFEAEEGLKTMEFKKKYSCALFKYLIMEAPRKIYTAREVKERTNEYIEANNDLFCWFKDCFIEQQGDYLKIKDIYDLYKVSDDWEAIPRRDRPKLKEFKDNITTNKHIKMYYKDRHKISQKTDINSVIVGWRIRKHDEMADVSDTEPDFTEYSTSGIKIFS